MGIARILMAWVAAIVIVAAAQIMASPNNCIAAEPRIVETDNGIVVEYSSDKPEVSKPQKIVKAAKTPSALPPILSAIQVSNAKGEKSFDALGRFINKCTYGISYKEYRSLFPDAVFEIDTLAALNISADFNLYLLYLKNNLSLAASLWEYKFITGKVENFMWPDYPTYSIFTDLYPESKAFSNMSDTKLLYIDGAVGEIFSDIREKYQYTASRLLFR